MVVAPRVTSQPDVLIVGSDAELTELLSVALRAVDLTPRGAVDGATALSLVVEVSPRVAVLDVAALAESDLSALVGLQGIAPELPVVLLIPTSGHALHRIPDLPGLHSVVSRDGGAAATIVSIRSALRQGMLFGEVDELRVLNQQIMQALAEGLILEDQNECFSHVNAAACELLGYSPEELIGKSVSYVVPPDQAVIMRAAKRRRLLGESDRYPMALQHKDGHRIPVVISAMPRFDAQNAFVGTISVFVDSSRQVRAEQSLMHRLEMEHLLTELSSRFVDADLEDLGAVIEEALAFIGGYMGVDGSSLYLADHIISPIPHLRVWEAATGCSSILEPVDFLEGFPPSLSDKLDAGQVTRISDVLTLSPSARAEGDWMRRRHHRSIIMVPFIRDGLLLGSLNLSTVDRPREWSEADVALLGVVAETFAGAIARRQAVLRMRRQADRLTFVNDLGKSLATTLDVDAICRIVYSRIGHVLDLAHLFIGEYDAQRQEIRAIFAIMDNVEVDVRQFPPAPLDPEKGQQTRAIFTREPVITGDMVKHRREYKTYEEIPSPDPVDTRVPHSVLTVPILLEGNVFGTLQIQSYEVDIYTTEDAQLLSGAANQLGLALVNARLVERVREEAQRLQEVMQTVPEGVLLVGADGRLLMANPVGQAALALLSDVTADEPLHLLGGRPWTDWLLSPPRGQWHELTVNRREGPEDATLTYEMILRPLTRETKTMAWVLVVRDVTEAKVVRGRTYQQERLAAVGQLAAGIAHDFNNIMAVIVLYAQMLQADSALPATARQRMSTIVDQAHHASGLITQILDFSRSSALELHPLDLGVYLKEVTKLLQRTLPEHIRVELAQGPDTYLVKADPTRIQQVLMNLAVNARDAMSAGGRFRLELGLLVLVPDGPTPLPELLPGRYVTLHVSDTGVGIPEEHLTRIFDPFFTTKPPGEGTGLGLAQVHGIIKQHGGEINVDSALGRGTTFVIYLPAVDQETDTAGQLPSPAGMQRDLPHGSGELLLVVEDNAAARASVVDTLQMLDYRTVEAADGREALLVFEAHRGEIALIVTDWVMPRLGGRGLVSALASRDVRVPVIVVSGHGYAAERGEAAELGVTDYLQKPVELDTLAKKVAEVLARRTADSYGSPAYLTS